MKQSAVEPGRDADLRSVREALTAIGRVQNSRRARRHLEDRAGVPLAPTTIETLSAIHTLGPVRHGPVAARVGIQPSRISKEVRALVEAGMVVESSDPDDRRAALLTVTDKGIDALDRYIHSAHETLDEVLGDWSATDLARLARLLGRLAESFTVDVPWADHQERS